jgi:hypothetical protein
MFFSDHMLDILQLLPDISVTSPAHARQRATHHHHHHHYTACAARARNNYKAIVDSAVATPALPQALRSLGVPGF